MRTKIATHRRQSYCIFKRSAKKQKQRQLSVAQGFGSGSIFLVVCVVMVGVLYLFTVNSVVTYGNTIYELEKNIAQLTEDGEKLQIQEAELRSLGKIKTAVEGFEMKEIENPIYIEEDTLISCR
jgi:cell division protein FtsL